jgi:hypothetical protein
MILLEELPSFRWALSWEYWMLRAVENLRLPPNEQLSQEKTVSITPDVFCAEKS